MFSLSGALAVPALFIGAMACGEASSREGAVRPVAPDGSTQESTSTEKAGAPIASSERLFEFPRGRSLGMLFFRPRGGERWIELAEATGVVRAPAGVELKLSVDPEGAADLSPLAAFGPGDLQVLEFSKRHLDDAGRGVIRIPNSEFVHLRGLESLRSLHFYGTQISGAGLAQLDTLTSLEVLDLSGCPIGDALLTHLKVFPALRTLDLRHTPISDAALGHLRCLDSLETLLLSGTGITNTGVAALGNIPKLKKVVLNDTGISDAGLPHLRRLRNLEELHLLNTLLTAGALGELERALPNCKIVRGLGWRPLPGATPKRKSPIS